MKSPHREDTHDPTFEDDGPPRVVPPRAVIEETGEVDLSRQAGALVQGRYRIITQVARGGMSVLYKAEQVPLGRVVALKVMVPFPPEQATLFETRFLLEAKATAQLTHPNTVVVHDYGRTDAGAYFIAMEYLRGRSLETAVRADGPFPQARAVHVALQICGSLGEAHDSGMVHRDLKPENVFLTHRGGNQDHVKVLDFGLVKIMGGDLPESSTKTRAGAMVGTPAYMPPEQIHGGEVDLRSDIYAFGALMFEVLTGQPPFGRGNDFKVMSGHMHRPAPPMREVFPGGDVDPGLELVIQRCLAKDPAARFPSMAEVAAAMLPYQDRDSQRRSMPWTATYPVQEPRSADLPAPGSAPGVAAAGAPWSDPAESVRLPAQRRSLTSFELSPRGRRWLVIGVTALLVLAVAVGMWPESEGSAQAPEAARTSPPGDPGAAGIPARAETSAGRAPGTTPAAPAAHPVRVISEPPGAAVERDGRRYGTTPLIIAIPEGERWALSIAKQGYEPRVVTASREQQELRVELQPERPPAAGKRAGSRSRAAAAKAGARGRGAARPPARVRATGPRAGARSRARSAVRAEERAQAQRPAPERPDRERGEEYRSVTENPDPWED